MDKSDKKPDFGWLRSAMPGVVKLMANKRAAMGDAHVNECFRRGMAGEPGWFFAREGPLAVGTPFPGSSVLESFQASAIVGGQALVMLRDPGGVAHGAN